MDVEETEEASLTESVSAIGDGEAYADIRKHTDIRGNDSNENEATMESESANKEGGIGKSTDSNKSILRHHLGEQRKRLETLSELQRTIVMHEIDNLFFRTTMGYPEPQHQSTSPGPASPASFYSLSSDDMFHTTPSIASLSQHSATSSGHQPPRVPVIPIRTDNDIQYLPSGDNYTCL
ncbi:hypothetical protein FQA39_LY03813 [Lamprigera yunnana]|nr:hypothetical protein FQA39_LY03813 [Lamprigera yunnana]